MILDQLPVSRVNARQTDAFDIHNSRFYEGCNPYLNTAAIAFDFALTGNSDPLPIETYVYVEAVGDYYPHLKERTYDSKTRLRSFKTYFGSRCMVAPQYMPYCERPTKRASPRFTCGMRG